MSEKSLANRTVDQFLTYGFGVNLGLAISTWLSSVLTPTSQFGPEIAILDAQINETMHNLGSRTYLEPNAIIQSNGLLVLQLAGIDLLIHSVGKKLPNNSRLGRLLRTTHSAEFNPDNSKQLCIDMSRSLIDFGSLAGVHAVIGLIQYLT